jgi:hypothetical protein
MKSNLFIGLTPDIVQQHRKYGCEFEPIVDEDQQWILPRTIWDTLDVQDAFPVGAVPKRLK